MKFYTKVDIPTQKLLLQQVHLLISTRSAQECSFITPPSLLEDLDDIKVIYRHYATLYFVFIVDDQESELGILDLIQVFVECLDKCFSNVCELDLVFGWQVLQTVLEEIVQGGMVIDTNINRIVAAVDEANSQKNVNSMEVRLVHQYSSRCLEIEGSGVGKSNKYEMNYAIIVYTRINTRLKFKNFHHGFLFCCINLSASLDSSFALSISCFCCSSCFVLWNNSASTNSILKFRCSFSNGDPIGPAFQIGSLDEEVSFTISINLFCSCCRNSLFLS